MNDKDLIDIIEFAREARNIEYKQTMNWENSQTKAKVVKAALAMSNIRDGGFLVFGLREIKKDTFSLEGMNDDDFNSFNYDDVASHINNASDPYVTFRMTKIDHYNKKYVVIKIDEFEEYPVIAKKGYPNCYDKGKIYTRTKGGKYESVQVPSQSEMREILDMALDKELLRFRSKLAIVNELQENHITPKQKINNPKQKFNDEIKDLL